MKKLLVAPLALLAFTGCADKPKAAKLEQAAQVTYCCGVNMDLPIAERERAANWTSGAARSGKHRVWEPEELSFYYICKDGSRRSDCPAGEPIRARGVVSNTGVMEISCATGDIRDCEPGRKT